MGVGPSFGGLDLTSPINRLSAGKVALAVNVRAYLFGGFSLRKLLSATILTVSAAINSLARLNDTTPAGPVGGYTFVVGSTDGKLYNNSTLVAAGLSGHPLSIIPFRPDASVQPWAYVGDSAAQGAVTLTTKFAIDNSSTTFACAGMTKVRSDGLSYKMGIKEPQLAPTIGTSTSSTTGTASLPATTFPWTNVGGANPTFNYGHSSGGDGTSPVIIATPVAGAVIALTVTGTATVNGATHAPGDSGPTSSTYPGNFIATPKIVVGAFTNGSGVVLTSPSGTVNIGASASLIVPTGATQLQIGVDSADNTFSTNSGSFSVSWTITTSAISTHVATLGDITAYVWGDSPHSGPVGQYIWKNSNDSGSGTPRTITGAPATGTNNSWHFDSTPENGTVPVDWATLDSTGSTVGSIPLFTPAFVPADGYQNFNACIVGALWIPAPGTYNIVLSNKDRCMLGIGGAATWTGKGTTIGDKGQTETVVSQLPLVPLTQPNDGGGYSGTTTTAVTFAAMGAYQVEIDWDYWYHTGRKCILTASPTPGAAAVVIPPLPQSVRTNVSYAYKYRSSLTGAQSNPSPVSDPQTTPVLANTVTPVYSNDPQVDKVDYYRQDQGLANFTYVATGPNTNPPTAIVDALTDLDAAANQLMQLDDFEPVPSIDLPRRGVVNVSGGVISWVSGDTFNVRWLAGTVILIGAPTQLAYTLIARPTSTTSMTIPEVPDGTNLVYNIAEPIIAAQPLAYLFGPTDNINFTFGVGDPLRPGTLYWCKGSNLDSWPDTNQLDVTDPDEILVNGAMSGGRGVLFSIERAWVIMPNFFNALATVTGTSGSTWSLQATSINRGLFIPRCLAVEGGGAIFFRVKDGIHFSPGGMGSKSITDDSLYPLFAHEGSTPVPIVRNGITVYPPDDSNPNGQQFSIIGGYLYYDYRDSTNVARTLVFDIEKMAWILDTYTPTATCHADNEGESIQGTLVGCSDGTLRQMISSGSGIESATATVVTPAIGGSGWMQAFEMTVEYQSNATVSVTGVAADSGNGSYGPSAFTLPSTSGNPTKLTTKLSPNKWKWLQFVFSSTDPTFKVFLTGFAIEAKAWGYAEGEYQTMAPFVGGGGEGAEK